jgi:hypothetical protein
VPATKKALIVLVVLGWLALCCMYVAAVFEAIGGSPDLGNSLSPVMKPMFAVLVVLSAISVLWTVRDNSQH